MTTMEIEMMENLWRELFNLWLKSIGSVNVAPWFLYKGRKYQTYVSGGIIDVAPDYGVWADIDLSYIAVDPCDPSFDPDKFFAPFKKWMDARTKPSYFRKE